MKSWDELWVATVVGLASVLVGSTGSLAQESRAPVRLTPPRDPAATWFRVDPSWPRRSELPIGEVPGIALDGGDRVYVLARAEPPVRVYSADGALLRSWGSGVIGKAHGIRLDPEGNIWIADIGRHVVRRFTPEGALLMTLGTLDESGADATHFNQPTDIAIAPDGELFVSDGYGNHRVVRFDRAGRFLKSWGRPDARAGHEPGEFLTPHALVMDSQGRLYVADRGNGRIQVFDRTGTFLAEWRDLMVPWGLWITPRDEIWACGSTPMPHKPFDVAFGTPPKDQIFVRFDTTGRMTQLWGVPKGTDGEELPGECNWVHGLAVDSRGNLYAGDIKGRRAQKFLIKP